MCLKRQTGHQKFSGFRVYRVCCRSKSLKQNMHFIGCGMGLPMQTTSLGPEKGPRPSLFLNAMAASYRTPWSRSQMSSWPAEGETRSTSSDVICPEGLTFCHSFPPTALKCTAMPVTGGTVVGTIHLRRALQAATSRTKSRGSGGAAGVLGSLMSPMQPGLLTGVSPHQRPLMRKLAIASYSMPSSRPLAIVSEAGAAIAVPPQRYQFMSPTRRSFTMVDLASSGRFHLTRIWPSVSGRSTGACVLQSWSTSSIPLVEARGSMPATEGSLGKE
mmetsp:Transcript_9494/g.21075  ORF Transcript_9494/g.21075 Transcript_9494/m.21075 type:complete len:273 (+) Transcript_9494:1171-1989(+)